MTSYLLLRNNKESGPYSLDQLATLGLKAYDLVWVTGKSAAWRYPGEITELKEFAPAVEEQPFDRFFKKPGEVKKEQQPIVAQIAEETLAPVAPAQPSYAHGKSVFVTMPNQKQQQPAKSEQPVYPEYKQYQPSAKEAVDEVAEPVALTKTITITENPAAAEIKYSQPLDEIKEMYVRTLQERKQKIAYKAFLLQALKKVAVILGIVGVGVLIGFTIKSKPGKKEVLPVSANIQPAITGNSNVIDPGQQITETLQEEVLTKPESHSILPPEYEAEKPSRREPGEKTVIDQPAYDQPLAVVPRKNVIANEPNQVITGNEPSPGVNVDAATGERTKKTRTANDEDITDEAATSQVPAPKAILKPGLSKLVSVKSNEYKKVAFGGIRGLELTVYNDSKYVLDNVAVELQYFKPSEEPLKTESLQFKSISPGGSLTIRVPDTNRGIKIAYRITNILSTQFMKDGL